MKIAIRGTKKYWFHQGLAVFFEKRTGWDPQKVRDFLAQSEVVFFNDIDKSAACEILGQLEALGFVVSLNRTKSDLEVTLGLPFEEDLETLKKAVATISSRIENLEKMKGATPPIQSVKESRVYREVFQDHETVSQSQVLAQPKFGFSSKKTEGHSTESNIGKYWLSRIGVFSLILGVVLFISYSFQFIGAWGKILTGVILGSLLIGGGNFLAAQEKNKKWAMSAVGGGWAILYFTIFAAYQIPVTKVIYNPLLGFAWLVAVIAGSITQSLKFKSPVLVFFSYFLGFVAITMVDVTLYTLVASFLLGLSIVIVTNRMKWSWLGLLGMIAVYLTHYVWLQPVINSIAGQVSANSLQELLVLPWVGEEWRIYPMITLHKSLLHQGFLILYWLLFTAIGFFKNSHEKSSNENLNFALLLINSFIFTTSYIHHLHVYYPAAKYLFPMVMGTVFLGLFILEQRLQRKLFADLYLAFAVTLYSLAVPMYFDGPWITYGWSAGLVILMWLGVRHDRKILRILSWTLSGVVALRLLNLDYAENSILFRVPMPVKMSFILFAVASAAYFSTFKIYGGSKLQNLREKRLCENIYLMASVITLGIGFLIGGMRAGASVFWMLEGAALMIWGIKAQRYPWRVLAGVCMLGAAYRLAVVDFSLDILKIFSSFKILLRLSAGAVSVAVLLAVGDWLRRKAKEATSKDLKISICFTMAGAILVLCLFFDSEISSWISIVWGICAFSFTVIGFVLRDKWYRWCGLGMFAVVVLRLFFHDFSSLATIYKIASFLGLGVVFITASFLYSYYSKVFLAEVKK